MTANLRQDYFTLLTLPYLTLPYLTLPYLTYLTLPYLTYLTYHPPPSHPLYYYSSHAISDTTQH